MIGVVPAVLLEEPYARPGVSDPDVLQPSPSGAGWQPDWRGNTFVPDTYQGFGRGAGMQGQSSATGWDPHTGVVQTNPLIHGYEGTRLQEQTMAELRAGSMIGFPLHGQTEPGFDPVLIEIPFDQGTDVGWQQFLQQGRRMLFQEPLDYSQQTSAIPAAGFP